MSKRTPKPHQKEAIAASIKHFKKHDKGKLIMACGTGKTLTSLWTAKALGAHKILITVPSLSLSAQNLDQWQKEFEATGQHANFLCVCSDKTVGHIKDEDDNIVVKMPVTTDVSMIRSFAKHQRFVIITTYASSSKLIKALGKVEFDLGIYDEAHKTAGAEGKLFSQLIFDKNIKAKKKLFMTATERIYSGQLDDVVSMDDEKIYGKKYYELSFREAIDRGISCDYEIKLVYTSDEQIKKLLNENSLVKDDNIGLNDTMRSAATAVMLYTEFKKGRIHRCISYHNTIKNARLFDITLNQIAKVKEFDLQSFHINGTMKAGLRKEILSRFANNRSTVLTNSRALTEGIDIPNLDSIAFVDRRNSVIDIAQALGRAIRRDEDRPTKKAVVYIPIADISTKGYEEILRVLRDLIMIDKKLSSLIQEEDYDGLGKIINSPEEAIKINLHRIFSTLTARRLMGRIVRRSFDDAVRLIETKRKDITSLSKWTRAYTRKELPMGFLAKLDDYPEYATSNLFKENRVKYAESRKVEWVGKAEFAKFVRSKKITAIRALRTLKDQGKLPAGIPYKDSTIERLYGKDWFKNAFKPVSAAEKQAAHAKKVVKLALSGKSLEEIALTSGLTQHTVKNYLRVGGLMVRDNKIYKPL